MTEKQFDTIIIGAGHNGLVCGNYLARAGQKVLLIEKSAKPGGLGAAHEFHPGFQAPVAHQVFRFSEKIAQDLDLSSHGLELQRQNQKLASLSENGRHIVIEGSKIEGIEEGDLARWPEFLRLNEKFAAALEPFWMQTIPRVAKGRVSELLTFGKIGLTLKRLGKADMREFLRVLALPTRDLMDEFFSDERLKAALGWDGLIGSRMAPRSPNNAIPALLYRMAGSSGNQRMVPSGGPGMLIDALESSARAANCEIRLSAAVSRIIVNGDVDGLKAQGVELDDGTVIHSDRVLSSADPKTTFFKLAGVQNLEIGFTNRIRRLRTDGLVAKLHLGLDRLPAVEGISSLEGRLLIAPSQDAIEFAFDDSKYGRFSHQPVMEICLPSLTDPNLAPRGQHVLSAHIMYVPYELKGGWTFEARQQLMEKSLDTLSRHLPGIGECIIGQELLTPLDLERQYGVTGGHWHHTEFALDQMLMMRPTYEAAQYRTPIDGLLLCGAGCHPAGDLSGLAGHNAAREVLR